MLTTHTKSATLLLAAGAIVAAGLGAAATANARPAVPGVPGVSADALEPQQVLRHCTLVRDGRLGELVNAGSFSEANIGALSACQNAGGNHCVLTGYSVNQCVALAVDAVDFDHWHSGLGPSVIGSQTEALNANGGGRIATVGCTNATGPNRAFTGRVNQLAS